MSEQPPTTSNGATPSFSFSFGTGPVPQRKSVEAQEKRKEEEKDFVTEISGNKLVRCALVHLYLKTQYTINTRITWENF